MYVNGILTGLVNLALFGLVVLLRRLIHKEGFKSFFWQSDRHGWRLLLEGIGVGLLSFGLYSVIALTTGQGVLNFSWDSLCETVMLAASSALGFFGVALFEESLFRGYILQKLLSRFSAVTAIGLPALLFGALHFFSYSSSQTLWIGILNAGLIAVVLSVGVIKSRSLLWALGFHWAWNLTQTVLMAEQTVNHRAMINLHTNDGVWAGSVIPESGVIATFVFVGLWLYISWRFRYSTEGPA